jgi:drug/metabolite transporter (DMT)-like permease
MLLLGTLFWGLSFPLVKNWQNAAKTCPGGEMFATLTLIAVRMILAQLLFAVFQPHLFSAPSRRAHGMGLLIGLVNCLGFVLQVLGLASTTPALSGFFTSLASAWVPVLVWLYSRQPVRGATLLGLGLGIGGTAALGIDSSQGWRLGMGETLTLLSSLIFAVAILLVDRLGRTVPSGHLTIGFMAGHGFPALLLALVWAAGGAGMEACFAWTISLLQDPSILVDIGLLTVFCTVFSFHWMTVYQPRVSASRAALIYLLEPVFASVFSIAWGHDRLTLRLVLGGTLILLGNVLVELPIWRHSPLTKNTDKISV